MKKFVAIYNSENKANKMLDVIKFGSDGQALLVARFV